MNRAQRLVSDASNYNSIIEFLLDTSRNKLAISIPGGTRLELTKAADGVLAWEFKTRKRSGVPLPVATQEEV